MNYQRRFFNDQVLLFIVFGLIIASRVVAVLDGRDPGFDQAMLMANFPLESFRDYFRPLPLFEQATSLGSVALLDLVSNLFGAEGFARFHAIRIWSAAAACLGYFILYLVLRQSFSLRSTALTLALIAAPNETLLFTSNPKNYVNAFLASCLLIWAGQAYLKNPDIRRSVWFLTAVLFTCLFAFTAPLIVAAVGGGMLVVTLFHDPAPGWQNQKGGNILLQLIVLGVISVSICLLFYLYFTKPVTILDQIAYADRYVVAFLNIDKPFSEHNLLTLKNFLNFFYLMLAPAYFNEVVFWLGLIPYYTVIHGLFLVIALIGFPIFWQRSRFLAGGLAAGISVILIANIAHILPISSARHFLFLTPFVAPCFALGTIAIITFLLKQLQAPFLSTAIVAVIALGIGTAATIRASDLENTEISELLARIDAYPAPLWIYYGAQPSVRALRPDLIVYPGNSALGVLPHESTTSSWMVAARNADIRLTSEKYLKETAADLAGQDPVWLLLTHYWPELEVPQGLDRFLILAEADGRVCRKTRAAGSLLALCTLPDRFPAKFSGTFE